MAGNAVIGALRIVLGADSAELETGLKSASKKLDEFAASAASAGRVMAASLAVVAVGLGVAIKGTINEADKLFKMSQKFGVPIEELSALKHAADLSGVSMESLGKSLGIVSRKMMETASNATGESAKAFQALGINVKNVDGTLKSSSQILTEVAGKFANMKDGAGKTALAVALFGRAGADLIPMLNQGKAGIQQLIDEARELGIVFDQRTGAAAEAFNDNLTRMRRVFDGIIVKVTAEMLPAFLQFSEVLVSAAKNSDLVKFAAESIVSAMRFMVTEVLLTIVAFRQFTAETKGLLDGMALWATTYKKIFSKDFWTGGKEQVDQFVKDMNRAGKIVAEGFSESERIGKNASEFINKFYQDANKGADALIKKPVIQNEAPIIQGNKDALDKYLASLTKKNAATLADIETVGLSEGAHQRMKVVLEAEAVAKENNIRITDTMRQKINDTANATGMLADRLQQTRDSWDNFRGVVLNVRSSLENAFVDAITQAKSLKDVMKSLISEFARLAAQQAFRSMFGGSLAWESLAGGIFNSGNVSGKVGGLPEFASGGAFKVGGTGGIDSQLVAFKASPNERVSITKPGQDMGAAGSVYMPITISADGADSSQLSRLVGAVDRLRAELPSRAIEAIRMANKSNMKLT